MSKGCQEQAAGPEEGRPDAAWMNCGIYGKPVPDEYAVHNLEHGAVRITCQPSLPHSDVAAPRAFVNRQGETTACHVPTS